MTLARSFVMSGAAMLALAGCGERGGVVANDAVEVPANSAATEVATGARPAPDAVPATPAEPAPDPKAPPPVAAAACQTQDGATLAAVELRAIGTEPFWGARIAGRCITYSTPEDQAGTRVWTKFTGSASSGTWSGALGGRQFELKTRPQADCSDGMSDERYPIAVTLRVGGETRQGCARPA